MSSRASFLLRTLVIAGAAFALLLVGLNQAGAVAQGVAAGDTAAQTDPADDDDEPIIQATERISIPFGFSATLPMTDDNSSVVASGVGACTAGNSITISYTVSQSSSGASVSGEWNGTCTGMLQTWTDVPTATPSPNDFLPGPATGCAFAETSDDEGVTATQDWCDPVLLGSHHVYLPIAIKP